MYHTKSLHVTDGAADNIVIPSIPQKTFKSGL